MWKKQDEDIEENGLLSGSEEDANGVEENGDETQVEASNHEGGNAEAIERGQESEVGASNMIAQQPASDSTSDEDSDDSDAAEFDTILATNALTNKSMTMQDMKRDLVR